MTPRIHLEAGKQQPWHVDKVHHKQCFEAIYIHRMLHENIKVARGSWSDLLIIWGFRNLNNFFKVLSDLELCINKNHLEEASSLRSSKPEMNESSSHITQQIITNLVDPVVPSKMRTKNLDTDTFIKITALLVRCLKPIVNLFPKWWFTMLGHKETSLKQANPRYSPGYNTKSVKVLKIYKHW